MNYLVILAVASTVAAARLDNISYLPPNTAANSINTGLQTPFETDPIDQQYTNQATNHASQATDYASRATEYSSQGQDYSSLVQILKYENEIDDEGWHYAYETSDGSKAQQDGRILPGSKPEEGSLAVSGSYSYVGDDGQTYSITYTADENGYHPSGDHLPTPPPIPEEILKSLQLTAGIDGQYDSQKSSYDADAGY